MTLVFHQAALGDFALVLPLLRRLPGPVTLITTWSRGRLAAALTPGLHTVDIDQFEFTRLHAPGGPSRLSPAVAEVFAQATLIVDLVGIAGDAWSANLDRLAPQARRVALPTRPPADLLEPLGRQHQRRLADAGVPLGPEPVAGEAPAPPHPAGAPILLHTGGGSPEKCWPPERWIELAVRLRARGHDARLIFGEAEAHRWSDTERQTVEAAGGRGLATLEALVESMLAAPVYAGHDTGPTHIAAQLGLTTFALFGPTHPAVWAPVGRDVRVLAPPGPCPMDWLTVQEVAPLIHQAQSSRR